MNKYLPPELVQSILSLLSTIAAALMGRLIYHTQLSQKSERKFFSKHLLFELAMAICIGFFAEGVASYFSLNGKVAFAAIIGISYIGPRGIEAAVQKFFASK